MKIETEIEVGSYGYFLHENKVSQQKVQSIQVTNSIRNPSPEVRYLVGHYHDSEQQFWVPAERAAKTKEALLAKL